MTPLQLQPSLQSWPQTMDTPDHYGKSTAKRKPIFSEKFTDMILQRLYRDALLQGGEAVTRALGHADAELSHNPGNLHALMIKGSLLTIIGKTVSTLSNRDTYIQTGVTLMDSALASASAYPAIYWEMAYLRASSLAFLTDDPDVAPEAHMALRTLVAADDFKRQPLFDQTRCLTLLAGLADKFGHTQEARATFRQARALDEALAIRLFDNWYAISRAGPAR